MASAILEEARRLASAYLAGRGQALDAVAVCEGKADDFPEVQLVMMVLAQQADRMTRYEQALHCYGDAGFWEDIGGGALADHDGGEMARNVLSGRTPFRDVC